MKATINCKELVMANAKSKENHKMNVQNAMPPMSGIRATVFRDATGYFLIDERKRYISPLFNDEGKLMDWAKQHGIVVLENARAHNADEPKI